MLYYVYFSNEGVPSTGLSPTWCLNSSSSSAIWSAGTTATGSGTEITTNLPAITEVGSGWYKFDITFGVAPWTATTQDLVGVIDGTATLAGADRYKPIVISLRGLALARIGHKGVQNKTTGDIDIYKTDGATKELKLNMTDTTTAIERDIEVAS